MFIIINHKFRSFIISTLQLNDLIMTLKFLEGRRNASFPTNIYWRNLMCRKPMSILDETQQNVLVQI